MPTNDSPHATPSSPDWEPGELILLELIFGPTAAFAWGVEYYVLGTVLMLTPFALIGVEKARRRVITRD